MCSHVQSHKLVHISGVIVTWVHPLQGEQETARGFSLRRTVSFWGIGPERGMVHQGCSSCSEGNPVLLCHLWWEPKNYYPDITGHFILIIPNIRLVVVNVGRPETCLFMQHIPFYNGKIPKLEAYPWSHSGLCTVSSLRPGILSSEIILTLSPHPFYLPTTG